MQRVLIVGASRILAPAAAELLLRIVHVTGVARSDIGIPRGVQPLVVDARTYRDLADAIEGRTWSSAIVYMPAVEQKTLSLLRSVVVGRLVEVRMTAEADPKFGPIEVPPDTLQLGWHEAPRLDARWHTPDEVSTAALEVLGDGRGRVLGALRPWERRPGSSRSPCNQVST